MLDDIVDNFCDECESPNVVSRFSDHDDETLEYGCRDCGADWVDYVSS